PDAAPIGPGFEVQFLRCKQQDRAGNRWLRNCRFVKIADGTNFGARQLALKGFVASLNAGDELGDIVLFLNLFGGNHSAFLVKVAADKPHPGKQLFRRVGGKIEHRIFLAKLRSDHANDVGSWAPGANLREPTPSYFASISKTRDQGA